MAWEVEIKAHVESLDAIKGLLVSRFGKGEAFDKRDAYYEASDKPGRTRFRLRSEGNPETGVEVDLVTLKNKGLRDGVEINEEIEFAISSPAAFDTFALALGYRLALEKRKQGWVWEVKSGLHVELADVSGLGGFIEIEALVDHQANIPEAEILVKALLESLGIAKTAIEPRYYTELLRSL